ncbi:hypothetical protein [Rhodopseudomonas pseudopalustris]|uniref:Uncharacterized protein n=2 Tax=Rhodopseudomonas TaxID=1073 RepID=Q13EJ5_RHOPS|nr:hypothetical protein [Rhodopseudomonas pseudopalustris]ABE37494.1 conserved hypothetical protein [Rhodopseudomonas palustris BisB5]MBB1092527.1 hypothetical protein [Rhodopseudomonas palustris]SEO18942.1 hypothetical protein SAMN05444123_101615 [Rhodopseudomonas pseudopalustris]
MIPSWSAWKRYPQAGRGNIEAPISPGVYEIRNANDGSLVGFEAVDNLAMALARLQVGPKRLGGWFGRRAPAAAPELEYRVCATTTRAHARAAAEHMINRRETWFSRAA